MAAQIQFVDYATSVILGALGPATTTIQLQGGTGAIFPVAGAGLYFYASLADVETGGLNQHEVVKVTNRSGDTLTVVRGGIIDGTPQAWAAGSLIEVRPCAQAFTDVANLVAGGAPTTSPYVLAASDPSLPNRRILTGSSSISVVDGGPANPITLSVPVNGIANAQLAQMPANTIKGNNTGALANAADLTAAQAAALIGAITSTGGVVSISAGTAASRPAAGVAGRVWLATDTGEISRDTGAVWFLLEPALTGDVTSAAGSVATTIAANAVTNAKLAKMAPATIKGNPLGSLNDPLDMTAAQLAALIPTFGPAGGAHARGLVPDPGAVAGLNRYLRDDATWQLPSIYTFNVIDYGADPTGATDSTAAINAAYNAIPSALGGVLYFPAGTYLITAALTTWAKRMTVMGDGWNVSAISTNSPTLDVATINSSVRVTGLRFSPNVARTAGREINILAGGSQTMIDDCYFVGHFRGIENQTGNSQITLTNLIMRSPTPATGVGISFLGAFGTVVANIIMDSAAGSQPLAGIMVSACGDISLLNCDIIHQGADLLLNPTTGQVVASIYAHNCFFDTAVTGLLIQPSGSGAVVRCCFTGCWFSSHTSQGIRIIAGGSTTVDGLDFTGSQCFLNGSHGVQVDAGAVNIRFVGGEFANNTGDGLQFNNSDFCVIGVKSGTAGALPGNTGFGVNVAQTTCNRFTVSNNDLTGNSLGAFGNVSTQTGWISGQNVGDTGRFAIRGKLITADFSNGTVSNRTFFQTVTLNGPTSIGAIPNGGGTVSNITLYNTSDVTIPSPVVVLRMTAAEAGLVSTNVNGGTNLPLNFSNSGINASLLTSGRWLFGPTLAADDGVSAMQINGGINITGAPNFIKADFSTALPTRTIFQSNQPNANTQVCAAPAGAAVTADFQVFNNSNTSAPLSIGILRCGAAAVQLFSSQANGGTILPIRLVINATIAFEVDVLSNVNHKKAIADQGYSLQTPLTGFTIVIPDGCSTLALNPGGVLATGTITMPANPIDGQYVSLCTSQTVTALTLNANAGQTISGNVTTLTATTPAAYRYFASITRWMKVSS